MTLQWKKSTGSMALCIAVLISCNSTKNENARTTTELTKPTVQLLWETDTLLVGTESVIYHPEMDIVFVSSMGSGDVVEKDGNGAIAQIDLEGNVINQSWVSGLNGPKGLGIYNNKLYVADITELVEIDIAEAKVTNRWEIEGVTFLNDVAITKEGVVYVTAMNTNRIYKLVEGKIELFTEGKELGNPNGIYADKDYLMLSADKAGTFGKVDYQTGQYKVLADSMFQGDGIEFDGNGNYLVSRWAGELILVNGETWKKESLLITGDQGANTADIDYIIEKKIILVPTFFGNTVRAYSLSYD